MAHKRPGRTVKVSVSLDRDDLARLKRRAKEAHEGNLSAAFAEAARLLTQREARRQLVDVLGGPSLSPQAAAAIDSEQQGGPRYEPKRPRQRKVA